MNNFFNQVCPAPLALFVKNIYSLSFQCLIHRFTLMTRQGKKTSFNVAGEEFNLTLLVLELPDGSYSLVSLSLSLSFFHRFSLNSFLILPLPASIYTYVWRNFNVLPSYRASTREPDIIASNALSCTWHAIL